MGDNSAARRSEIILRTYELKIFDQIHQIKLGKNVARYLRFQDDVFVHVTGEIDKMLEVIKIGMVFTLAEGGIDKTPKNARIPDNISLILSLYDSLP